MLLFVTNLYRSIFAKIKKPDPVWVERTTGLKKITETMQNRTIFAKIRKPDPVWFERTINFHQKLKR